MRAVMTQVALFRDSLNHYPEAPFHLPSGFPELARAGIREPDAGNGVYSAVRDLLALPRVLGEIT